MTHSQYVERRDEILENYTQSLVFDDGNWDGAMVRQVVDQLVLDVIGDSESCWGCSCDVEASQRRIVRGEDE